MKNAENHRRQKTIVYKSELWYNKHRDESTAERNGYREKTITDIRKTEVFYETRYIRTLFSFAFFGMDFHDFL